jgi:protein-tyrosine-phosphatase
MAEYLARHRYGNIKKFESAGIRLVPAETTKNAADTLLANFGIDVSAHSPRALDLVNPLTFELVVAIDDRGSSRVYKALIQRGIAVHALVKWKIDDPFGDDLSAYDRCALDLKKALLTLPPLLPMDS